MPEQFVNAIERFNAGEYFECHEILELLWKASSVNMQKQFYQGILQIAVGLYHLHRHNYIGARNLLQRGLEKLTLVTSQSPYQDWIDLEKLMQDSREIYRQTLETSGDYNVMPIHIHLMGNL